MKSEHPGQNVKAQSKQWIRLTLSDGGDVQDRGDASGLEICSGSETAPEKESGGVDDTTADNDIARSSETRSSWVKLSIYDSLRS